MTHVEMIYCGRRIYVGCVSDSPAVSESFLRKHFVLSLEGNTILLLSPRRRVSR